MLFYRSLCVKGRLRCVLGSVYVMCVYLLLSDAVCVRKAYELIRASASDGRSLCELRVLCAELSLQVPSETYSSFWHINQADFLLNSKQNVPFLFQVYLNLYLSIAHERIIHPYIDLESFFMFSKVTAAYYTLYVYEVKLWDTSLNVIFCF